MPTIECQEPMVCLDPEIACNINNLDMRPYTGHEIWVRRTVKEKILAAEQALRRIDENLKLLIYYGYRHPNVQAEYYKEMYERCKKIHPAENDAALEERTNQMIAHPSIAGHPTGGAIDATLLYKDKELDMGCRMYDFTQEDKVPTHSDRISQDHRKHRQLLLDVLKEQNFAPYYGEWWHFSYGDKEWAIFYRQPHAIFDQLTLQTVPFVPGQNRHKSFVIPNRINNF